MTRAHALRDAALHQAYAQAVDQGARAAFALRAGQGAPTVVGFAVKAFRAAERVRQLRCRVRTDVGAGHPPACACHDPEVR